MVLRIRLALQKYCELVSPSRVLLYKGEAYHSSYRKRHQSPLPSLK